MASAESEQVGSRIRRLRLEAGLAQTDLAGRGLSASYISLIESGKRVPSPEVLRQLAQRLKCPPETLTGLLAPAPAADVELELHNVELHLRTGDANAALAQLEEIGEQSADVDVERAVRWGRARALEALGRLDEAAAAFETLYREPSASRRVPRSAVAVALCRCYGELGDLGRGVELAEQQLAELEKLDLAGSAEAVELVAVLVGLYCERGDLHSAGYLAARAVERADALQEPEALAAAYWSASAVAQRNGAQAEALMWIRKADELYARGADERAVARLKMAYASVLLRSDPPQPMEATELLKAALARSGGPAGALAAARGRAGLARAALLMGDDERAVEHGTASLREFGQEHRLEAARVGVVLASAHLRQGRAEEAARAWEGAALLLEAAEPGRSAAFVWAELAEVLRAAGESQRAFWAYQQGMRSLGHREPPPVSPS